RAGRLHHEEALGVHDLALAAARAADLGLGAGLRAAADAGRARDIARDLDLLGRTPHGLGKREAEVDAEVLALRRATASGPAAEQVAEDVAERREDVLDVRVAARADAVRAADAVESEPIVARALILVGEDLVRVRGFLELVLGVLVPGVDVGVVL